MHSRVFTVLALALLAAAAAELRAGAPSLEAVTVSPDVTIDLEAPALVVDDEDAAFRQSGTPLLSDLGALPQEADLVGYELIQDTGDQLFVLDVTVTLPGGVTAGPAHVVRVTPAHVYTLESPALAAHVPPGAAIDALARDEFGRLVVSFDTTLSLPGASGPFTVADEDLVSYNTAASQFVPVFDGSSAGVPEEADLDAAHVLPGSRNLLLSFDVTGTVGSTTFHDEDVLEYDPAAGSFALRFVLATDDTDWLAADLDALHTADSDFDGIPDADDGCPLNPALSAGPDSGGVASPSDTLGALPDGVLDACQCGDVTNEGRVTGTDATAITRACLGLAPYAGTNFCNQSQGGAQPFVVEKCDVGGPLPEGDCSGSDAPLIKRTTIGLPPGLKQTCTAYLP